MSEQRCSKCLGPLEKARTVLNPSRPWKCGRCRLREQVERNGRRGHEDGTILKITNKS